MITNMARRYKFLNGGEVNDTIVNPDYKLFLDRAMQRSYPEDYVKLPNGYRYEDKVIKDTNDVIFLPTSRVYPGGGKPIYNQTGQTFEADTRYAHGWIPTTFTGIKSPNRFIITKRKPNTVTEVDNSGMSINSNANQTLKTSNNQNKIRTSDNTNTRNRIILNGNIQNNTNNNLNKTKINNITQRVYKNRNRYNGKIIKHGKVAEKLGILPDGRYYIAELIPQYTREYITQYRNGNRSVDRTDYPYAFEYYGDTIFMNPKSKDFDEFFGKKGLPKSHEDARHMLNYKIGSDAISRNDGFHPIRGKNRTEEGYIVNYTPGITDEIKHKYDVISRKVRKSRREFKKNTGIGKITDKITDKINDKYYEIRYKVRRKVESNQKPTRKKNTFKPDTTRYKSYEVKSY